MAMTKNIRTTVNAVSKLFAITNETHKCMEAVKSAETAEELIGASKALNNFSKRVDRLCEKFGFDREVVDEIFLMSEGCEDTFVMHILSTSEYVFSAYNACVREDKVDDAETAIDESDD